MTAVITLLTDWGHTDHYVASVKAALLRYAPGIQIVDISHEIRHFDIRHAAFVMGNVWRAFPQGSVHIIGIDSIESDLHPHVAVQCEGHYFVGADNGLISLLINEKPEAVVHLQVMQDTGYFTFPARDRFAKVAAHLALGKAIGELGSPADGLRTKSLMQPLFDGKLIHGRVMHIDSYQNVFVNISQELATQCFGKQAVWVKFRREKPLGMVKAYADVAEGDVCVLFASNGNLQIAINRGKAASMLGLQMDSEVTMGAGND